MAYFIAVPFSTDGSPTVLTVPWIPADRTESMAPIVKDEARVEVDWSGLAGPDLFRLSESLTPVPETPPTTPPKIVRPPTRRSSRISVQRSDSLTTLHPSTARSGGKAKSVRNSTPSGRKAKNAQKTTPSGPPAVEFQGIEKSVAGSGKASQGKKARESARPYPSRYTLLRRKFKGVEYWTRWWPIDSEEPLRQPPQSISKDTRLQVNDLCINRVADKQFNMWIYTAANGWEAILEGDTRVFDGERTLSINPSNEPDWVYRKVQKERGVFVQGSSQVGRL
ncbi:hypothetical protein PTI98_009471 [Pleurotus ostreatus]|nr:hypothetical protein PTI98_009471 [Pleurotus ostreatus]